MSQKSILMVVANPAVSTTTGWPVGFWASELIHPYDAFVKKGYRVTVASPQGGQVAVDAYSDPRDASGYSREDQLSLRYLEDPEFTRRLESTPAVDTLNTVDYDAIVVAGGQSPMFTFREAVDLQRKFMEFWRAKKVSAVLCHGTCLLLYLREENGEPFVKGKIMTGFADSEEDFADNAVGKKLMPFRIEDEARRLGARFIAAPAFQPHALRDGQLITGQQQHSGMEVARLVIGALEEGPRRTIAFIGIGQVGAALAEHLAQLGHRIIAASSNPDTDSIRAARSRIPGLSVQVVAEATANASVVFLATPFSANREALQAAGDLAGKVLVDCTNPVGAGMTHALNNQQSGSELVQALQPNAKVVKCFTIYGFENLQDNRYPGYGDLRPVMMLAGNDPGAKTVVSDLCRELGWEPLDTGDVTTSLHLEHLTLLWIKMARIQGRGSQFVWARLTR